MGGIEVVTDGIRAYGDQAAEVSAHVANAGAIDLAGNIAAMTPVFGAIGADFLAAFGAAQTTHVASVAQLAGHYASTAAAAHAAASGYDGADEAGATGVRQAGDAMGGRA